MKPMNVARHGASAKAADRKKEKTHSTATAVVKDNKAAIIINQVKPLQ